MNRLSDNLWFLLVGVVFLIMAIGVYLTVIYPLVDDGLTTPSERARPLTALEQRGLEIYKREGCWYCHSMQVRRTEADVFTWGQGRNELISRPGDYAYMWPAMWGTERQGPDLMWVGDRAVSAEYQVAHLKDPRRFKQRSIMPAYDHLPEEDLDALAAFILSRRSSR